MEVSSLLEARLELESSVTSQTDGAEPRLGKKVVRSIPPGGSGEARGGGDRGTAGAAASPPV